MSEILRAAVIGCGYISPVHLRGYKRLPNVKIAAVCDLIEERAVQAKKNLGMKIQKSTPTTRPCCGR